MQVLNTEAIEAVNKGIDTPDAFYHKSKLIATSKWIKTDGWRGYTEIVPEPGYKIIKDDWMTGDWSDAPEGHGESEVQTELKKLEAQYGLVFVIFAPTSNVFSTSYAVLVRDGTPEAKGKPAGHKTRMFTEADGSWRVRYHATDVIAFNAKTGIFTLNNGGWPTRTTHKRMNEYLPAGSYVHSVNYETVLEGDNPKVKLVK